MEQKRKGDHESMTLLPSFNGKKTRTNIEIRASLDYRLTGVKRLATLDPNFFLFLRVGAYYGHKNSKVINRKDLAFIDGGQYGY